MTSLEKQMVLKASELYNGTLLENINDLSIDVKNILYEYNKDNFFSNDKIPIDRILEKISSELQTEESISTMLLAMKSSQSKSFSNINKSVISSKFNNSEFAMDGKPVKQKTESGNDIPKIDDFHLTLDMSRKLLDHQFVMRQKMINNQLEKALCDLSFDMPLVRSYTQSNSEFIPNTMNQEFIALVGFNEVIDILKEQQVTNTDVIKKNIYLTTPTLCKQCGTDASPSWKKRKIDESVEMICTMCNYKVLQSLNRREIEEKIFKTRIQYEEQEKSLVHDYNDMLSSPRKLEMFRQEQEKRHKTQRLGTLQPNKPNRIPIIPSQNIKSQVNKPSTPVLNTPHFEIKNLCPSTSASNLQGKVPMVTNDLGNQRGAPIHSSATPTGDSLQAQLTYLQFLQAFTVQASNSQQQIDQENLKKIEQILAAIQSNPMLASNNMTLLQLIASLSTLQENSINNNTGASGNNVGFNGGSVNNAPPTNNLWNLVSYFVNLMQTQQNQNVVQ